VRPVRVIVLGAGFGGLELTTRLSEEFGDDQVALVDVTFFGDQRTGELQGPSAALAAEKVEFGSSRIKRWFGREWRAT
jgi:hypothetical protein